MKNEKKLLSNKKKLGQYFTKDESLLQNIFKFIKNNPIKILEPCIGQGDIVSYVLRETPLVQFDMFEIDATLQPLQNIDKNTVVYQDFLKSEIHEKYDTIVGNPPFVGTKKGNLYIDFVERCYRLLNNGGELIFIVPSDFFKLTSCVKIIEEMMTNGTFTDVYHPHKENLFENASIDVLIFRYCKNADLVHKTIYNGEQTNLVHNNGLITFSNNSHAKQTNISDLFRVCVGLVSGKEDVFKNSNLGNIEVLNAENVVDRYIFVDSWPTENKIISDYMYKHKSDLLDRKIRAFTDKNWFEWGAPRNISVMRDNFGKSCIYMYNLTRQEKVAFCGKVQYFGGGLLMLLPKDSSMSHDKMKEYVEYFNSSNFKQTFTFSGRFKIGQRQLCNSQI